ncbi:MAG: hypothetical protein GY769_08060 [bacterium]|nr:hypothetical protein [bacterium]
MNREVREQIKEAYRCMCREARYRPKAPGDGFGNITVPPEELDMEAEAHAYAKSWWNEEDKQDFWIGCCDFETRPETIFALEAARLLCGAEREPALRLLQMAAKGLKQKKRPGAGRA